MKKSLIVGMIAALAASFILVSCGGDPGGPDPEVAAEYRGTYDIDGAFGPIATLEIDATTATARASNNVVLDIFTGVYTVPGGTFSNVGGDEVGAYVWVYGEGAKVGIAIEVSGDVYIGLGTGTLEIISTLSSLSVYPNPSIGDFGDVYGGAPNLYGEKQ
ncbi:hypothetical protein FACS189468_8800 [Spirochaetia bacterium]|nr:hypothetical protein FACS189468_8800 [Spirochaetia bacterium]